MQAESRFAGTGLAADRIGSLRNQSAKKDVIQSLNSCRYTHGHLCGTCIIEHGNGGRRSASAIARSLKRWPPGVSQLQDSRRSKTAATVPFVFLFLIEIGRAHV